MSHLLNPHSNPNPYSDVSIATPEYIRVMQDPDYFPVPQIERPEIEANLNLNEDNPQRKLKVARIPITKRRRMEANRYFEMGRDGLNWYEAMYDDFVRIFRSEDDAILFIKFLAATSPNSTVRTNALFAFKAFALWKLSPDRSLPCRQQGVDPPSGKFGGFMIGHCRNLNRAVLGEKLHGPKVSAFVDAMLGDPDAVVIDRWMIRALGFSLPLTNFGEVTLHDGSTFSGNVYVEEGRRGYLLRGKKMFDGRFPFFTKYEEDIRDVFHEIEDVDDQTIFVPMAIISTVKFSEGSLPISQYRALARMVRVLAIDAGFAPRDYQAAVWTGIKIEQDPVGLENFVTYYIESFGEEPPSLPMLEQAASAPRFDFGELDISIANKSFDETEATALLGAEMLE